MTTAITALTRRIPLVNLNKGSTVPISLITQLAHKFAPVSIADGFGKLSVFDHVFNAQRFTTNHLVFVYQFCGELMGKVAAANANFCMYIGNNKFNFAEISGAFLLLGKSLLCLCQLFSMVSSVARIARLKAVRSDNKSSQAEV